MIQARIGKVLQMGRKARCVTLTMALCDEGSKFFDIVCLTEVHDSILCREQFLPLCRERQSGGFFRYDVHINVLNGSVINMRLNLVKGDMSRAVAGIAPDQFAYNNCDEVCVSSSGKWLQGRSAVVLPVLRHGVKDVGAVRVHLHLGNLSTSPQASVHGQHLSSRVILAPTHSDPVFQQRCVRAQPARLAVWSMDENASARTNRVGVLRTVNIDVHSRVCATIHLRPRVLCNSRFAVAESVPVLQLCHGGCQQWRSINASRQLLSVVSLWRHTIPSPSTKAQYGVGLTWRPVNHGTREWTTRALSSCPLLELLDGENSVVTQPLDVKSIKTRVDQARDMSSSPAWVVCSQPSSRKLSLENILFRAKFCQQRAGTVAVDEFKEQAETSANSSASKTPCL